MALDPSNTNRTFYLPRLSPEYYRRDAAVIWTNPIALRRKGWLNDKVHCTFRELLLHAQTREGLACPAYVLMEDHIHFVWLGAREDSDQRNGIAFMRRYFEPFLGDARFQHQPHDRVLREKERKRGAFASACNYVLLNPVRAKLVNEPKEWPYLGSLVSGYPELNPLESGYWEKFWRIYYRLRDPALGGAAPVE
jgi:putative transposase